MKRLNSFFIDGFFWLACILCPNLNSAQEKYEENQVFVNKVIYQNWRLSNTSSLTDSTLVFYSNQRNVNPIHNDKYEVMFISGDIGIVKGNAPLCGYDGNYTIDKWVLLKPSSKIEHLFLEKDKILHTATYEVTKLTKQALHLKLISEYYGDN